MNDIQKTLNERGQRYGDFTDHAAICQEIKRVMVRTINWNGRLNDVQRQALDVIADKIARILSGDPNYADNWHDIQGYAKLAEERLPAGPDVGLSATERPTEGCSECGDPDCINAPGNAGSKSDIIRTLFGSILSAREVQKQSAKVKEQLGEILKKDHARGAEVFPEDIPPEVIKTILELRKLNIHLKEVTVVDVDTKQTKTFKLV